MTVSMAYVTSDWQKGTSSVGIGLIYSVNIPCNNADNLTFLVRTE